MRVGVGVFFPVGIEKLSEVLVAINRTEVSCKISFPREQGLDVVAFTHPFRGLGALRNSLYGDPANKPVVTS